MRVFFVFCTFIFILFFAFSQTSKIKESNYLLQYNKADKLFKQSENIASQKNSSVEKEETLNKEALSIFQSITPQIEKAGNDSLSFFCYLKTGILFHYFDSSTLAKENYLKAIQLKSGLKSIADS